MRSRIYVTVRRPSVRLSVPSIDSSSAGTYRDAVWRSRLTFTPKTYSSPNEISPTHFGQRGHSPCARRIFCTHCTLQCRYNAVYMYMYFNISYNFTYLHFFVNLSYLLLLSYRNSKFSAYRIVAKRRLRLNDDVPLCKLTCHLSLLYGWLHIRVVSVLHSDAEGPGFKLQPRRCRVTVLGKLFAPIVPLFTNQRNW